MGGSAAAKPQAWGNHPSAAELAPARRVRREMGSVVNDQAGPHSFSAREAPAASPVETPLAPRSRWHVRRSLIVALAVSVLLHIAWSLSPVEFAPPALPQGEAPLTATLEVMPPPPPPSPPPPVEAPVPVAKSLPPPPKTHLMRRPRPAPRTPVVAVPETSAEVQAPPQAVAAPSTASANEPTPSVREESPLANVVIGPPADANPPVVLPPRLDLDYKVYFGSQGFMIGHATYRFEHDGDRYRISTVVEPSGLAGLFVHGKGLVESRGMITPQGLKPYEFVIERGSADKREEAYFDWDAGNVLLKGGDLEPLEPPAFDPLTIMWQPYFSPPSREDQTFTLATTRRVARYTLSLQGEETIVWRNREIPTQRWHELSEDGKGEGWFWLAPSMHYIPLKMRVARTARGTLEAVLDVIRTDANGQRIDDAEQQAEDNSPFKPMDPMQPNPGGAESHGQ